MIIYLIPVALIMLLLAMASGRWLVKRSLALLTVEQKALVMDAASTGNIWPLPCLAIGVALFTWVLPGRIPPPYLPSFFAVFLFTLVLVSVGATATSVVRLFRAGLPHSFVRSVALRAVLFFVAVLLLIAVFIYAVSSYPKRQHHARGSSNQTMKLTATAPKIHQLFVASFLPLRFSLGASSRSLSSSR